MNPVGDAPLVVVELAEHWRTFDLHLGLAARAREARELHRETELADPLASSALTGPDGRRVEPLPLQARRVTLQESVALHGQGELRDLPVPEFTLGLVPEAVERGCGNRCTEILDADGEQHLVEQVGRGGDVLPQLVAAVLLHPPEDHVRLERRLEGPGDLTEHSPLVLGGDEHRSVVEVLRERAGLLPTGGGGEHLEPLAGLDHDVLLRRIEGQPERREAVQQRVGLTRELVVHRLGEHVLAVRHLPVVPKGLEVAFGEREDRWHVRGHEGVEDVASPRDSRLVGRNLESPAPAVPGCAQMGAGRPPPPTRTAGIGVRRPRPSPPPRAPPSRSRGSLPDRV